MLPEPAMAVRVPPEQVVEASGVVATSMPLGRVSVKSSAVASIREVVLSMVKVSVTTSPRALLLSAKALEKLAFGITSKEIDQR